MRQKREATRVNAVFAISAEAALAQLNGPAVDHMETEIVGVLSPDLIRSLGLKPSEKRLD